MSYVYGSEGAYTAATVIDDPRQPRIIRTGILDRRGEMIVRVVQLQRVPMGFATGCQPQPDSITTWLPESLVQITQPGSAQ